MATKGPSAESGVIEELDTGGGVDGGEGDVESGGGGPG